MSRVVSEKILASFRDKFTFATKDVLQYFPGHMAKGLKQMQRKLKEIDCIIEVHDARIPFSGRNITFKNQIISVKPHILLLSKPDLADIKNFSVLEKVYKENGMSRVILANCKEQINYTIKKKLIPSIVEVIEDSVRYNRENSDEYNLMIIGIPNVGKSSLINALRRTHMKKGKANPVGPHAGVTRSLMTKVKVSDNPLMFLYDTPGVLLPNVSDLDTGMKLALCANLKDHLVGEELIVDYMLYWLNKNKKFKYADVYKLQDPTDNVYELLYQVAKANNYVRAQRSLVVSGTKDIKPDFHQAAVVVLRDFREGKLGKVNLDSDILQTHAQAIKLRQLS